MASSEEIKEYKELQTYNQLYFSASTAEFVEKDIKFQEKQFEFIKKGMFNIKYDKENSIEISERYVNDIVTTLMFMKRDLERMVEQTKCYTMFCHNVYDTITSNMVNKYESIYGITKEDYDKVIGMLVDTNKIIEGFCIKFYK